MRHRRARRTLCAEPAPAPPIPGAFRQSGRLFTPGSSDPARVRESAPATARAGPLRTPMGVIGRPFRPIRPVLRRRRRGKRKDPPRTRQSPVALAAFPPWGSWPGWRHAGSRHPVYEATRRPGDPPGVGVGVPRPVGCSGPACAGHRRIRLVAYGARLESVLGESPRGFESPILRQVLSLARSGDGQSLLSPCPRVLLPARLHLPVHRHRDAPGSGDDRARQALQGLTTDSPVPEKSLTFRVARRSAPAAEAVAATTASAEPIGFPARSLALAMRA